MKRAFFIGLFFLFLAFLTALFFLPYPTASEAQRRSTSVASLCASFYQAYGGIAFFGAPISEAVHSAQGEQQIFTNAELFCTPDGVHLTPLGAMLFPPDADPPAQPDPLFAEWIEQHGGLALFGPPLTAAMRNEGQHRWEQHFRYLGVALYDGHTQPELLPYGQWFWAKRGSSHAIPARQGQEGTFPAPLVELFRQMGGAEVLGAALTPLYLNYETGDVEIVFEHAVAGITRVSGYTVARLLPVVQREHLVVLPPEVARLATPDPAPRLRFWQTDPQSGEGHNFLEPFYFFLQQHGGVPVLCGQPIGERQWGLDGRIEQWCTQVGLWLKDDGKVGLRPVGRWYLERVYPRITALPSLPEGVRLTVEAPSDFKVGQILSVRVTVQGVSPAESSVLFFPPGNALPQVAKPNAQGVALFAWPANDPALVGSQLLHVCLQTKGQGLVGCQMVSVLVLP